MMRKNQHWATKIICLAALILLTAGCANRQQADNHGIIIDSKGVDMQQYHYDLQDCQQYAEQVPVAGRTAKTAVGGAAVGGVIGAVVGNSDTAAKGAGVGAVTGAVKGVQSGVREKQQVVKNCLRGRGYRVLN